MTSLRVGRDRSPLRAASFSFELFGCWGHGVSSAVSGVEGSAKAPQGASGAMRTPLLWSEAVMRPISRRDRPHRIGEIAEARSLDGRSLGANGVAEAAFDPANSARGVL